MPILVRDSSDARAGSPRPVPVVSSGQSNDDYPGYLPRDASRGMLSAELIGNLNAELWGGALLEDYLDQAVRSLDSPTFSGLNLSSGLLVGRSGERIQLGATDDYIDFVGAAGSTNQTLRLKLDDPYGPRFSTNTGSLLYFDGYVVVADTADSWGRMLTLSKTNFDLSAGSTRYPLEVAARASTYGSRGMNGLLFDVRGTAASGTQTGAFTGAFGQVYISGAGAMSNDNYCFRGLVSLAAATTMAGGYGYHATVNIAAGVAGQITQAAEFWGNGIDAQSGTVGTAYGLYVSNHRKAAGGTLNNAYGIRVTEQTNGGNNYEVWLDGSGEVFFRDSALHIGSLNDGHLDLTADVSVDVHAPVLVLPVKSTTGDPTGQEGAMYVNTQDNALRLYADGAWRSVLTW